MTARLGFTGIDSISFGVKDMEITIRLYSNWGLKLISASCNLTVYKALDAASVFLRKRDEPKFD